MKILVQSRYIENKRRGEKNDNIGNILLPILVRLTAGLPLEREVVACSGSRLSATAGTASKCRNSRSAGVSKLSWTGDIAEAYLSLVLAVSSPG